MDLEKIDLVGSQTPEGVGDLLTPFGLATGPYLGCEEGAVTGAYGLQQLPDDVFGILIGWCGIDHCAGAIEKMPQNRLPLAPFIAVVPHIENT